MSNDHHLANKYRPLRFKDVLGQEAVVGAILGSIQRGKIRPGLLLHGPHSTGKTSIARLYGLYINCGVPDPDTKEPCGTCPSCKLMESVLFGRSNHPDVIEMNAALHGGIDRIRQLEALASQAPRFRNRVFIMDEAHQITGAAFNGALKIIEDPPARTKFVFNTTNPEKIPDAIWSRCQCFKLEPLSVDKVAKRLYAVSLLEGFKPFSPKLLKQLCLRIADASHGHLRDAMGMLDNAINYAHSLQGKEDDVDAIITKVVSDTPTLGSYDSARMYCAALFARNIEQAFIAIAHSTNVDYMVRNIIEIFQLLLCHWIDNDSLVDPSRMFLIKGIDLPNKPARGDLAAFGKILHDYVSASERIKLYAVDPVALLQALTLQTVSWFASVQKNA